MPAAAATIRISPRLTVEPDWPWWAAVVALDYQLEVRAGWSAEEFADGSTRQEARASTPTMRRLARVLVPAARGAAWRRMLARGPAGVYRWRDPDDGVVRRVTVIAPREGLRARRRRGDWETDIVLAGLEGDTA